MNKISGRYLAKEMTRRKTKPPVIIGDTSPDIIIKTPIKKKKSPGIFRGWF